MQNRNQPSIQRLFKQTPEMNKTPTDIYSGQYLEFYDSVQKFNHVWEEKIYQNITTGGSIENLKIYLTERGDANFKYNYDKSILLIAVIAGSISHIQELLNFGANVNDYNLIPTAITAGNYDICKLLIRAGANLNCYNTTDDNPLTIAVGKGHTKLIQLLIDEGADVNSCNASGNTPLMVALIKNDMEMYEYLKSKGGKPLQMNQFKEVYKAYDSSAD